MKRVALLLFSAAIALPAYAADSGPYAALDVQGWSTTNNAPFGNPGVGLRIAGGYHFTPYIGAEVGYAQSSDSSSVGGAKYHVSSLQLAAVGTYPINDMFDVFGKVGVAGNKVNTSGPLTCNNCSKTDALIGVGGQYNINRRVGIRLQYEYLGKATDTGINDMAASTVSLGAVYNF